MRFLFLVVLLAVSFLQAKAVSDKDLTVQKDYEAKFGNIEAQVLHFGGYKTPKCQFAISNDGQYFYFTKLNSTCKRLKNSKGKKIVCNSDKSVCKTREELIAYIQNNQDNKNDSKRTVSKEDNDKNAEIKKFLTEFINSNNQDNIDKVLSFYGAVPNHDYVSPYFSFETATLSEIKKDKIRFFKKWSKRNYSLVDYSIIKKDDWYETAIHFYEYIVRVTIDWKVSNNKKEASGRTVNKIYILATDVEPGYKVIGIKSIKSNSNKSAHKINRTKEDSVSDSPSLTALELLKSWCNDNKDALACLKVGLMFDEGDKDISIDDYKAVKYYRKACRLGSAKGCYFLGMMYGNGEGVNKDLNEALVYLDKGCSKGVSEACNNANTVRNILKNRFRGVSKNKCYGISKYAPQKVCLEGTGGDACYAIKDYGLQRVCREGAKTDACYALKDYGLQRVCREGIRSDACYALKSYNMQKSCRSFSGSTTFWIILSYYGYYVH